MKNWVFGLMMLVVACGNGDSKKDDSKVINILEVSERYVGTLFYEVMDERDVVTDRGTVEDHIVYFDRADDRLWFKWGWIVPDRCAMEVDETGSFESRSCGGDDWIMTPSGQVKGNADAIEVDLISHFEQAGERWRETASFEGVRSPPPRVEVDFESTDEGEDGPTCASDADCRSDETCRSSMCEAHWTCGDARQVYEQGDDVYYVWNECSDGKRYEGACHADYYGGPEDCHCTVNDTVIKEWVATDDEEYQLHIAREAHRIFNARCGWLVPQAQ